MKQTHLPTLNPHNLPFVKGPAVLIIKNGHNILNFSLKESELKNKKAYKVNTIHQ